MLADIGSTGFGGAESGGIRIGDAVAVFAQGPIGVCAAIGAKLMGAALVIGVDGDERRLAVAKRLGVDVTLNYHEQDVVAEIKRLSGGGVDVSIEALGTQETFESALRCLDPAEPCRASECIPANYRFRTRRLRQASEIIVS